MNLTELDRILLATLDDQQLSRSERQALAQVVADESPNAQELATWRSRAFELARQHLSSRQPTQIIDWLQQVTNVLAGALSAAGAPGAPGAQQAGAPAGCPRSQAFFSPDNDCTRVIIDHLDRTKKTLDICVFTITDDRVASAISRAHQRGVNVRIITDNEKAWDAGSDVQKLGERGVPIRIDQSEHHMHHKFAIFDKATLITGSFNWTRSASIHNEENLIVTPDPSLVKDFLTAFEKLWNKVG